MADLDLRGTFATPTLEEWHAECVRLLKGPPGTEVVLSIARRGWAEPRTWPADAARPYSSG